MDLFPLACEAACHMGADKPAAACNQHAAHRTDESPSDCSIRLVTVMISSASSASTKRATARVAVNEASYRDRTCPILTRFGRPGLFR